MSGFPTTRWSAIRGLKSPDDTERKRGADAIAAAYWRPVYKHLRFRWKKSREDAEDLTQGFFGSAFEKYFLADFDPAKARFRTFVRMCVDRWAANADKAARRLKRGGGTEIVADFDAAESELAGAAGSPSAEELFDREVTRSVLAAAIHELKASCTASGKEASFEIFEKYDLADEDERPTYETLARESGVPVTTVTNRLAFARKELRRIVLEKLDELSATDDERRDEARRFFGADP